MITTLSPGGREHLTECAVAALKKWGERTQALKAAEELSELTTALLQAVNKSPPAGGLALSAELLAAVREEIADAYIVLEQMADVFFQGDQYRFNRILSEKLAKLVRAIGPEAKP